MVYIMNVHVKMVGFYNEQQTVCQFILNMPLKILLFSHYVGEELNKTQLSFLSLIICILFDIV